MLFQRSVAILATPLRHSLSYQANGDIHQRRTGTPPLGSSPQSIRTTARISQLTTSLAHLEAENAAAKAQVTAIQAQYAALTERYENDAREKALLETKLVEYEGLTDQCRDMLEQHEELLAAKADLEEQLSAAVTQHADSQRTHTRLKWKEKKLRCELANRRQEGRWQELADDHAETKSLRLAIISLKQQNLDLEDRLQSSMLDRNYQAEICAVLRKELEGLLKEQAMGNAEGYAGKAALDDMAAKHAEERMELTRQLGQATKAQQAADANSKRLVEEAEASEAKAVKQKEQAKELKAALARVMELEREVKKLEKEKHKAVADQEQLRASLGEQEDLANAAKTRVAKLEKEKLKAEKEAANNREQSRQPSSPPRSMSEPPAMPKGKAANKRKRAAVDEEKVDAAEKADGKLSGSEDDALQLKPAKKARTTAKLTHVADAATTSDAEAAGQEEEEEYEAEETEPPNRKRGRPPKKATGAAAAAAQRATTAKQAVAKQAKTAGKKASTDEAAASEGVAQSEGEIEEELVKKSASKKGIGLKTPAFSKKEAAQSNQSKTSSSRTLSAGTTGTGKTKLGTKNIFAWGGQMASGVGAIPAI